MAVSDSLLGAARRAHFPSAALTAEQHHPYEILPARFSPVQSDRNRMTLFTTADDQIWTFARWPRSAACKTR